MVNNFRPPNRPPFVDPHPLFQQLPNAAGPPPIGGIGPGIIGGPPYLIAYCWTLGQAYSRQTLVLDFNPPMPGIQVVVEFPAETGFVGWPFTNSTLISDNVADNPELYNTLVAWTSPFRLYDQVGPKFTADAYSVFSINSVLVSTSSTEYFHFINPGSKYANGDIGFIGGGLHSDAQYIVTKADVEGHVQAVAVWSAGSGGYSVGPHPTAPFTGDGDGTLVVNITGVTSGGLVTGLGLVESAEPYITIEPLIKGDPDFQLYVMLATVTNLYGFQRGFSGSNTPASGLIVDDGLGNVADMFVIETMMGTPAGFDVRTDYPSGFPYNPNIYSPDGSLPFVDCAMCTGNNDKFTPITLGLKSLTFNVPAA